MNATLWAIAVKGPGNPPCAHPAFGGANAACVAALAQAVPGTGLGGPAAWGAPERVLPLPRAQAGSHEDLLHRALDAPSVLVFGDDRPTMVPLRFLAFLVGRVFLFVQMGLSALAFRDHQRAEPRQVVQRGAVDAGQQARQADAEEGDVGGDAVADHRRVVLHQPPARLRGELFAAAALAQHVEAGEQPDHREAGEQWRADLEAEQQHGKATEQ